MCMMRCHLRGEWMLMAREGEEWVWVRNGDGDGDGDDGECVVMTLRVK